MLLCLLDDVDFRRSRRALARGLRERGVEVCVLARLPDGVEQEVDGVRLLPWTIARRGARARRELRTIVEAVRTIRRWRPTVVHCVGARPILLGGIAAAVCRVPLASTVTGLGFYSMHAGMRERAALAAALAALGLVVRVQRARTIAQNRDDRAALISRARLAPHRIALVRGSGVDPQEFLPPMEEPAGAPIVLCAGRLLREKGVLEFVAAAERLRGSGARFVLVGGLDPENRGSLGAAEIRAIAEAGAVEWWGERADMPAVIAGASIVCVPSWGEGLPKALLEAGAAGRAIVTTDVPGCREIFRDGMEGLVVPPRDPAALAGAIARLLAAPELRARLGQAARARVLAELTDAHVVAATLDVYRELGLELGAA